MRDHPRACGEHFDPIGTRTPVGGSSPRLRGTQKRARARRQKRGIIPALAGNTVFGGFDLVGGGDHPRACGEHMTSSPSKGEHMGSSPRLRGTLLSRARRVGRKGIIPALAGNTNRACIRNAVAWDHPRACGEHWSTVVVASTIWGSSPRLRGTPIRAKPAVHPAGIIPALAGNTAFAWLPSARTRDHPRACGEHHSGAGELTHLRGSSPRLRGTRLKCSRKNYTTGIIPALAGNTASSYSLSLACRDHPRACGEHNHTETRVQGHGGSSPRLRGTRGGAVMTYGSYGIIPALAGNTGGGRAGLPR